MSKRRLLTGHLASFGAYTIFGLNILFTKDLTGGIGLSPLALFTLRSAGAALLFWITSLFLPKERVEVRDYPRIALAAFIGFFLVQICFLVAMPQSTAVDVAVIGTLTPVLTMIFAAVFIHEPITLKKAGGVAMSLGGILFIILTSTHAPSGVERTSALGWVLLFCNIICFAAYLGMFKPLIAKYHVVTFMKWVFLFSLAGSLPFTAKEILAFDFAGTEPKLLLELGYLIVLATFVAYFLIPVGQKNIRPTLVSMYCYVQPVITATVGIVGGTDVLSPQKIAAILLVCAGVWTVNNSRSAEK